MRWTVGMVAAAAMALLAGCGPSAEEQMMARLEAERQANIEAARELVRNRLNDPESAQFRNEKWVNRNGGALCGEVNAKNRMGGYVGFSPFVAGPAMEAGNNIDGVALKGDPYFELRIEQYCK